MASDFEDKIKKLAAFDRVKAFQTIFADKEVRGLIIELNIKQLQRGKDSKDKPIGRGYYSARSVKEFGKKPGPIVLFEHGDFYASIHTEVINTTIVIDADGQKGNTNLFNRYGVDVVGLDGKSMNELGGMLKMKLAKYIWRLVGMEYTESTPFDFLDENYDILF